MRFQRREFFNYTHFSAACYGLFGALVVGGERAGARWSAYRFHLDSPITFTKSLSATIEHGHADDRADNYYLVAYWYQTEPHAAFPVLPAVEDRLPRLHPVGDVSCPLTTAKVVSLFLRLCYNTQSQGGSSTYTVPSSRFHP